MPFAIVDKIYAKVFVFDAGGRLRGAAPALLGMARGDDTIPGIGDRKLSDIPPRERVTPAGRFVASLGFNVHGKDVLWVDYNDAVSLHRVVTNNPKERRLERLASPKPLEHRISWGCINVPANFYIDVVTRLLPALMASSMCCRKPGRTAKPSRRIMTSSDVGEQAQLGTSDNGTGYPAPQSGLPYIDKRPHHLTRKRARKALLPDESLATAAEVQRRPQNPDGLLGFLPDDLRH